MVTMKRYIDYLFWKQIWFRLFVILIPSWIIIPIYYGWMDNTGKIVCALIYAITVGAAMIDNYMLDPNPFLQLRRTYKRMGIYARKNFPENTTYHHLLKLKEETNEAIAALDSQSPNPKDRLTSKIADCLLCVFTAAYSADINIEELMEATRDKLKVVQKREWVRQPDGTYQHVK